MNETPHQDVVKLIDMGRGQEYNTFWLETGVNWPENGKTLPMN